MNRNSIDELGEPSISLAGLKIWIHGYQFQSNEDYWDGNWLRATAIASASGAQVWVSGSFIRNTELDDWGQKVQLVYDSHEQNANLECMEPELSVSLKTSALGKIEMVVQISPDNLTQEHRFEFEIDQSYLPSLTTQCAKILSAYPIRGREDKH
ncbi:WapI family immunity protein [Undibacterium sp. Ji22W]|uniref:WapI family immunity protein n=1 Tax=Undibacterium sp. Ji22W TaxID=3413038 RepID=UPI003BF4448F